MQANPAAAAATAADYGPHSCLAMGQQHSLAHSVAPSGDARWSFHVAFQRRALLALPPEEMGSPTQPFWVSSTDTAAHSRRKNTLKNMTALLFVESFSIWSPIKISNGELHMNYILFWVVILWFIHLVRFIDSHMVLLKLYSQSILASQIANISKTVWGE